LLSHRDINQTADRSGNHADDRGLETFVCHDGGVAVGLSVGVAPSSRQPRTQPVCPFDPGLGSQRIRIASFFNSGLRNSNQTVSLSLRSAEQRSIDRRRPSLDGIPELFTDTVTVMH
jgi:hypothetical protein